MHIEKAMAVAEIIIEYDYGSIVLIKRANEPYKNQKKQDMPIHFCHLDFIDVGVI